MPEFTVRLKLRVCSRSVLGIDEPRLEWRLGDGPQLLVLTSGSGELSIRQARELYLVSAGWGSETDAAQAAHRCLPVLFRTLARLRVGVDTGDRRVFGGLPEADLATFRARHGVHIINDALGLLIHESDPARALSFGSASISSGPSARQFHRVFDEAMGGVEPLGDRERVCLALFNASFFQESCDARLLMLSMAFEALLNRPPLSHAASKHIQGLIVQTQSPDGLTDAEAGFIVHALRDLKRRESIRQAGFRLADRLGERVYQDKPPREFFDHCYELRSRLAHGDHALPSVEEVGAAAAGLEVMVSDLLADRLRDVDPNSPVSG